MIVRQVICPSALLALCMFMVAAPARAEPEPIFGVTVSMAPGDDGKDVRGRDWVYERLDLAERIFAPLGVHVHLAQLRTLDANVARVGDPKERDAFASRVTSGTIDVFVVRSLRDADDKAVFRQGVTWDSRTAPSRRFILLASDSRPSSLAHELGHFFGIQPHSKVKNNLMSYDREDAQVFFDPAQMGLVKNKARALLASGTLAAFGLTTP